MSQSKIQAYMDRHRLGPLFEDLMNRVLRDMPEEPTVYLLRSLYKKAGMEIPQDIRYGGLRKSVDLPPRSRSPDRAAKGAVFSSSDGAVAASREYEKPWLTQTRRMKPRRSGDEAEASRTGKKRPDWQGDTKISATSFDELWEDQDGGRRHETASPGKKARPHNDPRTSWASVGLDGGETFTSGDYRGPSHRRGQVSEEDLLAVEMVRISSRDASDATKSEEDKVSYSRGQRFDYERHQAELEKMLHSGSTETKVIGATPSAPPDEEEEDDAIELLENADDLLREGVKNVPKSGYKLSRVSAFIRSAMKWQNVALKDRGNEPQPLVKLNINLSPRFEKGFGRVDSMQSFGGYESDQENESPAGKRSAQVTKAPAGGRWESDDEFESVSQVTGPRRPVWQVPDSDAESSAPYGGHKRRSKHRQEKRGLASTVPTPFQQSALRAGDLDPTQNLTWSPGLRPEEESSPEREDVTDPITDRSGGWVVPDDSDAASLHDWNQRVKGKRRDPRAY